MAGRLAAAGALGKRYLRLRVVPADCGVCVISVRARRGSSGR